MSTNFPTALDTLTNPTPTDYLNSPSHAGQHANANDAIEAIQAKLGIDSSAVTTSHDYKLSEVTGTDKAVGKTATQTLSAKTLTAPKIDTINEETAGNGVVVDGIKLKDGNTISNTGTADHISIVPGTSKLVKLAVLRQDDTTNNYKNNTIILTGWGWKIGDGASTSMEETINFGITFSETPVFVASLAGQKITGNPTDLNEGVSSIVSAALINVLVPYSIATNSAKVVFARVSIDGNAVSTFGATGRYMYSWIAIGQLN